MERAKNLSRKKQENVVKLMDLSEFILDAHDTKSCGNVLDSRGFDKTLHNGLSA